MGARPLFVLCQPLWGRLWCALVIPSLLWDGTCSMDFFLLYFIRR